jgi:hypothetical protein
MEEKMKELFLNQESRLFKTFKEMKLDVVQELKGSE